MGPFIFPSDVKKISNFLHLEQFDFVAKWCEKNAILIKDKKIDIFTLKTKDGKCSFLDDNNLCEIFNYRPYQCIYAPYNFIAKYSFWSHMPCVKKEDFINLNSLKQDEIIFSELLNDGYKFI